MANGPMTEEQWRDVPRPGEGLLKVLTDPTYLLRKGYETMLPYTPEGHIADILYNRQTQSAYKEALRRLLRYIPLPSPREW